MRSATVLLGWIIGCSLLGLITVDEGDEAGAPR
jgi:hypothetical protein